MNYSALTVIAFSISVIFLFLKKLFWTPKLPSLSGKHVVITGGSSGIGKAVGIKASELGANVTIIARNIGMLKEAQTEIMKAMKNPLEQKINFISFDVTSKYEDAQNIVQQCESENGPIFMLVNCAGMAVCSTVEDTQPQDFHRMMDLNYFGTVNITKATIPGMKARQSGHIVITGSQASLLGIFGFGAYCASKYALRGLAESLYMELKSENVAVTLCLPPDTDTPGFENEEKDKPEETKLISEGAGLADPKDVAYQLLLDALGRRFFSTVGLESLILTTLSAGMSPLSSVTETILQIALMSLLRLVSVGYILNFYKIINMCKQRRRQKQD